MGGPTVVVGLAVGATVLVLFGRRAWAVAVALLLLLLGLGFMSALHALGLELRIDPVTVTDVRGPAPEGRVHLRP